MLCAAGAMVPCVVLGRYHMAGCQGLKLAEETTCCLAVSRLQHEVALVSFDPLPRGDL